MTSWQPIETAPRDGTSIILATSSTSPRNFVGEGYFEEGKWWWAGVEPGDKPYQPIGHFDGCAVTHWMPLPEPPQQQGDRTEYPQESPLLNQS